MHVFPQLRRLERKYHRELAVVGVHSAKFTTERETPHLARAVQRHQIQHPVVNDRHFQVWQQYGVRAWPTLMFIDPTGKVVGRHEGEIPYEAADRLLADMVQEYDGAGLLDRRELPFLQSSAGGGGALSFPAKVLAHGPSGRLFISDTNHDRIILASLDGQVRQVIGAGEPGLQDGGLGTARFNQPHGLALEGDTLYVADTENHAIRRVDLSGGTVETIAGTGEQARMMYPSGKAREVPLNSPWDLVHQGGVLYIAMAGFHQLWSLDLAAGRVAMFAGSGQEGIADGLRLQAWLAQPSGITTDGQTLYFADSETSAIRMVGTGPDARVETIVGVDLFDFGDVDGPRERARLQHPLGVAYHEGVIYTADTYNNKIKQVFPQSRHSVTFLGTGEAGHRDGQGLQAQFDEPGGLSFAGERLYIADTNNHAIRVADVATRKVETLELRGL